MVARGLSELGFNLTVL
jgi:hypothetical protein